MVLIDILIFLSHSYWFFVPIVFEIRASGSYINTVGFKFPLKYCARDQYWFYYTLKTCFNCFSESLLNGTEWSVFDKFILRSTSYIFRMKNFYLVLFLVFLIKMKKENYLMGGLLWFIKFHIYFYLRSAICTF